MPTMTLNAPANLALNPRACGPQVYAKTLGRS